MANPQPSDNVQRLDQRAEVDLRMIRSLMQRTAVLMPMPGWGIFTVGLVGVITSLLTRNLVELDWIVAWGIAALLAVSLALLISGWHIRRTGKSIYVGNHLRFWLSLVPGFFAATLFTWIFVSLQEIRMLPGVWLLLYGVAVTAAGSHSIPQVRWMGISFLMLGAIALFLPWQNVMMGLGFGGLHLAFGLLISRSHHD